ncbi:hypothetical protein RKD44_000121 [Streptomyces collinus]
MGGVRRLQQPGPAPAGHRRHPAPSSCWPGTSGPGSCPGPTPSYWTAGSSGRASWSTRPVCAAAERGGRTGAAGGGTSARGMSPCARGVPGSPASCTPASCGVCSTTLTVGAGPGQTTACAACASRGRLRRGTTATSTAASVARCVAAATPVKEQGSPTTSSASKAALHLLECRGCLERGTLLCRFHTAVVRAYLGQAERQGRCPRESYVRVLEHAHGVGRFELGCSGWHASRWTKAVAAPGTAALVQAFVDASLAAPESVPSPGPATG